MVGKKSSLPRKYIVAVHILGQHYPAETGAPLNPQSVQFVTQVLCIFIFIAALQPLFQATTYSEQTPTNSFTILGTLFNRVTLILCKHTHGFSLLFPATFFFPLALFSSHSHAPAAVQRRVKPGRRFLMSLSAGSPGPRRHISLYYSWPLGRVR